MENDTTSDNPEVKPSTPSVTSPEDNSAPNQIKISTSNKVQESFSDNPGMDRVKLALKQQLKTTRDRLKDELIEKEDALREAKKAREDCGVHLYGVQQQLARLQDNLVALEKEHESVFLKRENEVELVEEFKQTLQDKRLEADNLKKKVSSSLVELSALNDTIRQIKTYNEEVQSEITVTRRVASKAEENVKALEKGKIAQDVYINRLNEQIKGMEVDLALTEKQLIGQHEQTKQATEALQETSYELELLMLEKKQLIQQWKSSIAALNRRDEALMAAGKAHKEAKQKSEEYKLEANGIIREIEDAKMKIETMKAIKNRFENEIAYLDESIQKVLKDQESSSTTFEILQQNISFINEEESKLKSSNQKLLREISLTNHKIQNAMKERHLIEDQVASNIHDNATYSKASKSLLKEDKSLLRAIHEKEIEAENIKNELARIKIDTLNTEAHSSQLTEKLEDANEELKVKDKEIQQSANGIRRRNNEIESKMNKVGRLNRKYEKMMEGVEEEEPLGPLQGTIKRLQNNIKNEELELQQIQKVWLVDQSRLIKMIGNSNFIQEQNSELSARLNILLQKKVRVLQSIYTHESELKSIEKSTHTMHKDMARLNDFINENSTLQESILNENTIMEKEFAQEIKELEFESSQMEAKIDYVKQAKIQVQQDIFEVEKEFLHWEKKIRLEKETKNALDSSEEMKEIKGMEKEIHRMQNRMESINREEEKLIRDMEQTIYRKEDIAVKFSKKKNHNEIGKHSMSTAEMKKKTVELRTHSKQIEKLMTQLAYKIEKCKIELHETLHELEQRDERFNEQNSANKEFHDILQKQLFEKQRLLAKIDRYEEMTAQYKNIKGSNEENIKHETVDTFQIEKKMLLSRDQIKRIQSIISGLRIKHSNLDEVLERVGILASDVLKDLDCI